MIGWNFLVVVGTIRACAALDAASDTTRIDLDAEVDSQGQVARMSSSGTRLMRTAELSKSEENVVFATKVTDASADCSWSEWSAFSACVQQVQTQTRTGNGICSSTASTNNQDCASNDVFANLSGSTVSGYLGLAVNGGNIVDFMTNRASKFTTVVARVGCLPLANVWVAPVATSVGVKLNFVLYASPCNVNYVAQAAASLDQSGVQNIVTSSSSLGASYAITVDSLSAAVQSQTHITGFLNVAVSSTAFSTDANAQAAMQNTIASCANVNGNYVTIRMSASAEKPPSGYSMIRIDFLIHVPATAITSPTIISGIIGNLKVETPASVTSTISQMLNAVNIGGNYDVSAQKLALVIWPKPNWACAPVQFSGCSPWTTQGGPARVGTAIVNPDGTISYGGDTTGSMTYDEYTGSDTAGAFGASGVSSLPAPPNIGVLRSSGFDWNSVRFPGDALGNLSNYSYNYTDGVDMSVGALSGNSSSETGTAVGRDQQRSFAHFHHAPSYCYCAIWTLTLALLS